MQAFWQKTLVTLGLVVAGLLFIFVCTCGFVCFSMKDQVMAVQSLHQIDEELYEMTYDGNYGIDAFIEQGGVHTDAELRPFLQNFLSHGMIHTETGDIHQGDYGCSTLAAPTEDGIGYLFGRNFDWAKKGKTIIVTTHPKNGYASISTSCLDFLGMPLDKIEQMSTMERMAVIASIYVALDGINEKGLCVADLFAGDHEKTCQERGNLCVTTTTAIRLLLDCAATTDEAIKMLDGWDMHSSVDWAHHLAISDATGHSVVVEWLNNEMIVTETPAVTNHYLSPLRPHVGIGATEARRDTLCARLERQPSMTLEQMRQLLEDVSFDEYTGWSVIFDTRDVSATYYYRTDYTQPFRKSL